MPEQLPKGWAKTTLGEIVEPSRQRALPTEVPDLPYVGLEHIEPQTMKLLRHGYARDIRSSSVRFSKGDVLYGKMRPYLNKVWLAEFDGICSAEFLVLRKSKELDSQFLAFRLNAEDFTTFANEQVSGDRPRVDFEKLSHFSILLPPRAEQDQIAAKLNAALLGLERANAAASRAQERLKHYGSAVLHAAVTGELTRAWREAYQKNNKANPESGKALLLRLLATRRAQWEEAELQRLRAAGKQPKDDKWKSRYQEPTTLDTDDLPELPPYWCWATLDQIGQEGRPIIYGIIKPGPHDPNGVPYVRVTEMKDGQIDVPNLRRTSSDRAAKFKRSTLHAGDLLISKDGTIGRVAVVPPELAGGNITQHVIRAPINEMMYRSYVVHAIRSDVCQAWLTGETRGIALQGVNVEDFRRLPIPIPPYSEQLEISSELQRRLLAASRLAATLEEQLARARDTRRLLLYEAFTGRLVPQGPDGESASELLDRIRVTRKEVAELKNRQKTGIKKKPLRIGQTMKLLDIIKQHFSNCEFTFDSLRKEVGEYDYERLKKELFELLRPAEVNVEPILQMSFNTEKEMMEFKLISHENQAHPPS